MFTGAAIATVLFAPSALERPPLPLVDVFRTPVSTHLTCIPCRLSCRPAFQPLDDGRLWCPKPPPHTFPVAPGGWGGCGHCPPNTGRGAGMPCSLKSSALGTGRVRPKASGGLWASGHCLSEPQPIGRPRGVGQVHRTPLNLRREAPAGQEHHLLYRKSQ